MTEQDDVVVAPTWARVQLVPGAEKVPVPDEVKLTLPVGNDFVPLAVSETVAVQTDPCPTETGFGVQTTAVLVVRVALNVAVTVVCPPPRTPSEHGLKFPAHVPMVGDQPTKVDPASAVALRLTVAPLSELWRLHAWVSVIDFVVLTVDPGHVGPWKSRSPVAVTTLTVTEPLPVPAKMMFTFLAAAT